MIPPRLQGVVAHGADLLPLRRWILVSPQPVQGFAEHSGAKWQSPSMASMFQNDAAGAWQRTTTAQANSRWPSLGVEHTTANSQPSSSTADDHTRAHSRGGFAFSRWSCWQA
jgi:hypothetical protein